MILNCEQAERRLVALAQSPNASERQTAADVVGYLGLRIADGKVWAKGADLPPGKRYDPIASVHVVYAEETDEDGLVFVAQMEGPKTLTTLRDMNAGIGVMSIHAQLRLAIKRSSSLVREVAV